MRVVRRGNVRNETYTLTNDYTEAYTYARTVSKRRNTHSRRLALFILIFFLVDTVNYQSITFMSSQAIIISHE